MDNIGRSEHKPIGILLAAIVFACLGALALYWSVAPKPDYYPTLASLIFSYLVIWGVIFLCDPASRTDKASRFLLASASFTLTVSLLELLVLARVIDFRTVFSTRVTEPWQHPDNLLDPTLLHIHKPYDHWLWMGTDYRYDQYGLRNETDLTAADVVVVGDSFVEGYGVQPADMLTTHLSRQLDRPVANLGQSYYGPQQELELLRRYGLRLAPKLCVWVFYEGNDLDDLHRYKRATQDWEAFSKHLHSFGQRSFTKNMILALRRVLHLDSSILLWLNTVRREQSGLFKHPSGRTRIIFVDKGHHLSASDYAALKDLRAILQEAWTLCRARGAKFLVVFVPTKYRAYEKVTEFGATAEARYWVINQLPDEIEKIVHEDLPDAGLLDLTGVFVKQAMQGQLLYFDYDAHWTPEGHRVAATAISDVIRDWKLAPDSARRP